MKDTRSAQDFLIHLAKHKLKELQSTKEGLEMFPVDNELRAKFYIMGFVDGFNEGAYFKEHKKKSRIVTV